MRITGLPFDAESYKTERKVENAEIKVNFEVFIK